MTGDTGRKGSAAWAAFCSVSQQPVSWAAFALAVAALGGAQGRRTAVRAGVAYSVTGMAANMVLKPIIRRPRPAGAGGAKGTVTSSFPSGHSATEVAFALAAAQEIPSLLVPLLAASLAGKVSLIRTRGHYLGDVVAGSAIGVAVAGALWRLWPPRALGSDGRRPARGPGELIREFNHYRFRSIWDVEQAPDQAYDALQALEHYAQWWPEIKAVTPSGEGQAAVLTVRSFLPYSLRFSVAPLRQDPAQRVLEAEMAGDLAGRSKWTLIPRPGGCQLVFEEDVVVGRKSLRLLAPIARGLFNVNHTLMMRHGELGLRRYLAQPGSPSPG